ncbi:Phage integrase family protein [Ruminococcus sp. YE71]|uniref:site-specific integrase n=1 Tax=unclassified Ruminococcus TaxID=2608920 RepID=UPI00088845C3|nr:MULTISPECIES: site-specific integrase [unclassified Ruminococcus]SDA16345.1 Phage integrase family protein [Ruminococcus sp. YE78]SFW24647.1 Phage integrase family protein [Ruminococcus sp. YE71]
MREVETLPIKWRTIIHLLMVAGARRAEICGLKWDAVDWENCRIYIHINLLYSPEIGVYEDTPKTEYSERYIKLPQESMELLHEYQKWYEDMKSAYGDRWHDTNFLFFQEKVGNEGKPMNPDTVTRFLDEFSEKHNLPHINPHAFRHTMASVMCYNRIDPVSISRRLGHSKVSTTTDYYSHMLKDADDISAETIADVMLRRKPPDKTG